MARRITDKGEDVAGTLPSHAARAESGRQAAAQRAAQADAQATAGGEIGESFALALTTSQQGKRELVERLVLPLVEAIRPHLSDPDMDLVVPRAMLCEELARRAGYADWSKDQRERMRSLIRYSLDEADLRHRADGKGPLRTLAGYCDYKPAWGVSVATIYRYYTGIEAALDDAELLATPSPRHGLTRKNGRPAGRKAHSWNRVLWDLARMFEFNFGRRFSNGAYDLWAERADGDPVSSDRVLRIAKRERGWQGKGTFQDVCTEALLMIRDHWRSEFPITAAHLDLCEKVARAESRG